MRRLAWTRAVSGPSSQPGIRWPGETLGRPGKALGQIGWTSRCGLKLPPSTGSPSTSKMISPWTKPERMDSSSNSRQNAIAQWFSFGLLLVIFGFGIWMAGKNLRAGRGDARGSRRLGLFVFVTGMVNWVLLAHHVSSAFEILFFGMVTWLLYAALEPYVRRYWPDTLISWSRMLSGNFKDPVFARDVLLGTLFGLASAVLEQLQPLVEAGLGKPPMRPWGLLTTYSLEGIRGSLATILYQASSSFSSALLIFSCFLFCD